MSVNRSVQAAQRRRAGPSNNEPSIPGRTPQPSINSAQMFANQSRSGSGPNIPVGRLAGQQEAMNQKQGQSSDKLSSVSKMTIAQAITLITLRLGAVETKLMQMPEGSSINDETNVDPFAFQNILSRLETLEKRAGSTSGIDPSPELKLIKQQFDTVKQAVVQNKSATTNIIKENNALKTEINDLKKELLATKELLETLQKITLENSESILNLSIQNTDDYNDVFNEQNIVNLNGLENVDIENVELENVQLQVDELQVDELEEQLLLSNQENDIVGTDLKKLIESELSCVN
jgi:chorismate mutase